MFLSHCNADRCCRSASGTSRLQLLSINTREAIVSDSSCGHYFCWLNQLLEEASQRLCVQGPWWLWVQFRSSTGMATLHFLEGAQRAPAVAGLSAGTAQCHCASA